LGTKVENNFNEKDKTSWLATVESSRRARIGFNVSWSWATRRNAL